MEVRPELGGRITSLTTGDGFEWLLPSTDADRPGYGAPFLRPGMGGWDEVCPSVSADVLEGGRLVPDHGDVWNIPWDVEAGSSDHLTLQTDLVSVPVKLQRTISRSQTGFTFSYTAATRAAGLHPVLWCAHPQFFADERTIVRAHPEEPLAVPDLVEEYPEKGRHHHFPLRPLLNELKKGTSFKAFVPPDVHISAATITQGGGSRLRIGWSADELPYLGLFWDNGEFASQPALAVEPSTGFGDSLSAAAAEGLVLSVSADQDLSWKIHLSG